MTKETKLSTSLPGTLTENSGNESSPEQEEYDLLTQYQKVYRSNVIGVIVNNLSSIYFSEILGGIEFVCSGNNMHMFASSGFATIEVEREGIDFFIKRDCEALILSLEAMSDAELAQIIELAGMPVILQGRLLAGYENDCISFDNEAGGEMATNHLIEQNHKKIAIITGLLGYRDARLRFQGYLKALNNAGLSYSEDLVVETEFTVKGGYRAFNRLLERKTKFSAIFAGDDEIAAGVVKAMQDADIKVPEEISIVGFDDIPLAEHMSPPLTTIRQPTLEMGGAAAKLVLNKLKGKEVHKVPRVFPPELIIRKSVRSL